jgi:hypothetical protein
MSASHDGGAGTVLFHGNTAASMSRVDSYADTVVCHETVPHPRGVGLDEVRISYDQLETAFSYGLKFTS